MFSRIVSPIGAVALTLSAIVALPAPAALAAMQRGVTGMNVTRVLHTGGGSFEHLENGRWVEFGHEGNLIHEFEEQRRDATGVWLFDRARGVRVVIDLRRREISGTPAMGAPRLLYRITDVDADRRGRGWRGRPGGGGNGGGGGWDRGNGGRGPDRGNGGGGRGRESTSNVEVGPIWNQADAETKCRNKAREMRGEWTGQWSTTVPGRMSVCEIRVR